MKVCALIVALLLLVGCAADPLRCDQQLTPINASSPTGPRAQAARP